MKKILFFLPLLLVAAFVAVNEFLPDSAEAARFGGGRSFGGSSFNRSAPIPRQNTPYQNPSRNPAGNSAQAVPGATPVSGFGGMMGGLLAGSLLGSLFAGGDFNGIKGADLLVMGVVVFLLLRLFRSRRQSAAVSPAQSAYAGKSSCEASADAWDRLRGNSGQKLAGVFGDAGKAAGLRLPPDFDPEDFMQGAKTMFTRMQESWDSRDLDDIALVTNRAVLREIRKQAGDDPGPSQTDIMMLNAELLDFQQNEADQDEGGLRDRAAVDFEVLLREDLNQETRQVREIWHFIRRREGAGAGDWKLGGLQQVEG
jgi:predicted lipid-binding transport protein (Tim44 family)